MITPEILQALAEGKRVRRRGWAIGDYITLYSKVDTVALVDGDWELWEDLIDCPVCKGLGQVTIEEAAVVERKMAVPDPVEPPPVELPPVEGP